MRGAQLGAYRQPRVRQTVRRCPATCKMQDQHTIHTTSNPLTCLHERAQVMIDEY